MDDTKLASLVASRICHDIVNPLSAIGNGVELLQMTGQSNSPEMQMISDAVANANASIKFFRIAFGHGSDDTIIGATEVHSLLSEINPHARVKIDWQVPGDIPRKCTQVGFLLSLCLESAMPYGGEVVVHKEDNRWTIHATARKFNPDLSAWDQFQTPSLDLAPRLIHFTLAAKILADNGRVLKKTVTDTSITVNF